MMFLKACETLVALLIVVLLVTWGMCHLFHVGYLYRDAILMLAVILYPIGLVSSMAYNVQRKETFAYEAEFRDGSVEKVESCYKKGNKNVCTLASGDKKVVVDFWEIEE